MLKSLLIILPKEIIYNKNIYNDVDLQRFRNSQGRVEIQRSFIKIDRNVAAPFALGFETLFVGFFGEESGGLCEDNR